ncbi:unnamed protein product [Polarella glacialis]|uniref:Tubulin--tyrosine ligase-like protein 9 n=1 Tax=Polarella glacialis TaxID=89957 RepID=A0A813KC36_POLGL|nr:unnamed protein product [Polarella glacialis]
MGASETQKLSCRAPKRGGLQRKLSVPRKNNNTNNSSSSSNNNKTTARTTTPSFKRNVGLKRKLSVPRSPTFQRNWRRKTGPEKEYDALLQSVKLVRPSAPVGEKWPIHDLRSFDAPTEGMTEINYGPLLKEVLKERGWKYSTRPCHGTYDGWKSTFYIKEFEASLQGLEPAKAFGKSGAVEDGYHLQAIPLPKHALWMLGRLPFRVPGTANECARDRDDFAELVVRHGDKLTGKPGNYRIAKFPGTETILFKTNFTKAFNDKPWYPATFILPNEQPALLKKIRSQGDSRSNYWIGKPKNDYGGTGICVWKGTDPELVKAVVGHQCGSRSIVQQYLADPLLIGGYKFHCRIHLVITNIEPLEAYVQENGQCLFATKPYTLSGKTLGSSFDPPAHVTNMGLNATPDNKVNFLKKKPIIGKGQQIRMRQLMSHLACTRPSFRKRMIWQQILHIAKETAIYIASGVRKLGPVAKDRHFEIFGMDLMLDRDLKVWMCEVNTDPGLGYPDEDVLGSPNPDYKKELQACSETLHDMFALLGLDAGLPQSQGSLQSWYKVDFSDTEL